MRGIVFILLIIPILSLSQSVLERAPVENLRIDSNKLKPLEFRGEKVFAFENYIPNDSTLQLAPPEFLPDGKYVAFYKNDTSKLAVALSYLNGKQNGFEKRYFENGQIERVANYNKGALDGHSLSYYKNGKLQADVEYKNGNLVNGIYYSDDGKIYEKTVCEKPDNCYSKRFEQDKIVETEIKGKKTYIAVWDLNGKLVQKELYKNGKLVYLKDYRNPQ